MSRRRRATSERATEQTVVAAGVRPGRKPTVKRPATPSAQTGAMTPRPEGDAASGTVSGNGPARSSGGRLALPALRAEMGAWIYYTAAMRLADVADRVRLASDIYKSRSLSELLQRAVSDRAGGIATYLRTQHEDRFFNALVLGVSGGDPLWHDIDLGANPYLSADEIELVDGQLGAFVLSGSEQLYAIDGQHRVEGIRLAVSGDDRLGDERLTVIFVPYETMNAAGLRRTRRLFTTLNRYAKPVSKRDSIALDEDDSVAIVTRRLVETYPLFKDEKASTSHTKALPVSDTRAFTTVVALYDAMDIYLQGSAQRSAWNKYKRFRPDDEATLDDFEARAIAFWDAVRTAFPPIDTVANADAGAPAAAPHRSRNGGHPLFRPVGLRALVRAVLALERIGVGLNDALGRLAATAMDLSASPWAGVLWSPASRKMLYAKENQDLAFRLWFVLAGGPLPAIKVTSDGLREEWTAVLGGTRASTPRPLRTVVNPSSPVGQMHPSHGTTIATVVRAREHRRAAASAGAEPIGVAGRPGLRPVGTGGG